MSVSRSKTVLGFGASGAWAQPWFSKREAIALIHKALDHGVRHFDTAGFYAHGEAEKRLGEALRGRNDVFISVKTGTQSLAFGRKVKDFSPKAVRIDLEASLRRLGRENVNTLYLHGPDYWVVENTREVFHELKSEGLVERAGVCGQGDVLAQSVSNGTTNAIMGTYNLFNQAHGRIFQDAKKVGILTTAIAPLAQAFYRPGFFKPVSLSDCWIIARALVRDRKKMSMVDKKVRRDLGSFEGCSSVQVMMAFVASREFVDIVMTTTTKPNHLEQSIAMVELLFDELGMKRLESIATKFQDNV